MKHLVINSFGTFLGLRSQRIVVLQNKTQIAEIALKNLKTISVNSGGVSISSDLITACANYGIKIFFNSFQTFCALHTPCEHKSANVLKMQFANSNGEFGLNLAREFIIGKIKNSRSSVLYFSRSSALKDKENLLNLFENAINSLKFVKTTNEIFGIEGSVANAYFDFLRQNSLLPSSFETRTKQNSTDITNKALNYGYAILLNFVYKSVINAGLNPYCGVLHVLRSGKPSLCLDIMEEYRSFVVDRNIIKMRSHLSGDFDKIKKEVAQNILDSFDKKLIYHGRKLTLSSIMQRQIYRLAGAFCEQKRYKSYIFRW